MLFRSPQYAPFFEKTLYARSNGRGLMEYWTVFPGVVLSRSRYQAGYYEFCHAPLGSVLQINHCRQGRLGWDMRDDASIYLGEEDISFHKMDVCAESVAHLPAGYYEGMAVMIDMEALEQEPPAILREAGVSGRRLCETFCGRRGYAVMAADLRLDGIFSGLYALPSQLQLPYFKLKIQELLLFLSALEPAEAAERAICSSWQIAIVQAVHKQLTERLDRRFTIEELSRQHGLNPSALKAVFKCVCGAPMAAYMRRYRLRFNPFSGPAQGIPENNPSCGDETTPRRGRKHNKNLVFIGLEETATPTVLPTPLAGFCGNMVYCIR